MMKKPRLVSEVNRKLAGRVGEVVNKGWLPVTLGGDHSLVCLFSFDRRCRLYELTLPGAGHSGGDQVCSS